MNLQFETNLRAAAAPALLDENVDVDLERVIWDLEYRRIIIERLNDHG